MKVGDLVCFNTKNSHMVKHGYHLGLVLSEYKLDFSKLFLGSRFLILWFGKEIDWSYEISLEMVE